MYISLTCCLIYIFFNATVTVFLPLIWHLFLLSCNQIVLAEALTPAWALGRPVPGSPAPALSHQCLATVDWHSSDWDGHWAVLVDIGEWTHSWHSSDWTGHWAVLEDGG